MKTAHHCSLVAAALTVAFGSYACAQISQQTLTAIGAADRIETRAGTLEFKDGVPTVATAEKVRDTLDFTRALNVYNNSFRGASAYALGKGFQSIGAEDNTIVIFQDLMDAKSLFLTANADTVYFLGVLNLSKGPLVVEQPPGSLGTFNDMWFSWIIDGGFPGPDRGEGGKYLLLPPGYDGPLPDGGFFVAKSKTNRVLYGFRAFLVNDDPKPTVENIKKNQDLSLHGGWLRHKHRDGARRERAAWPKPGRPRDQVRGCDREGIQHHSAQRFRVLRDDQRERPAGAGDQL